jgi:hypothetical protein
VSRKPVPNDARLDQLSMDAPELPTHRPPTKREVWDRYSFIYGDIKPPDELTRFCRDAWVWLYVEAFNFRAWRKQPDWVDGDPVIDAAVPTKPFPPDQGFWTREVKRLHEIATRTRAIMDERRAA